MAVHAILSVAAAAAAPLNASSPAENPLLVDAALARWDMGEARTLAQAMPEGAERCAVEGVIANRENRIKEASNRSSDAWQYWNNPILPEQMPHLRRCSNPISGRARTRRNMR